MLRAAIDRIHAGGPMRIIDPFDAYHAARGQ